MNSSSETKVLTKPKNTLKKDKKFQTGRWTEKEHYLFLLAVKKHGKDWKKIEGFVKTRSSTQSRSHAQKVLKDDLMNNLENEIARLALIYEDNASAQLRPEFSGSSQENSQTLQGGPKTKRKAKRVYKEAIKKIGNENIVQLSNMSSENNDDESKQDQIDDDSYEESEYSYPDDYQTKLFEIEKVKMKTSKRKRKATKKRCVAMPSKVLANARKDSMLTSASANQSTTLSPVKTSSTESLTPNLRGCGGGEFRVSPFNQMSSSASNKNGGLDESKPVPQNGMVPPNVNQNLRRATSTKIEVCPPSSSYIGSPFARNDQLMFLLSTEKKPEFCKPPMKKRLTMEVDNFNSLLFEDCFLDGDYPCSPKHMKISENSHDSWEDSHAESLLFGDSNFPLFDQY
ncbi:unnamed protein product [Moneuplotes crassus]|uniref:Uncharacterized protein n=1 Tax=Euplotes crassus TaxID=5936 RepID=A0AAD1UQP8_EUPCR|nr:unnamed protein product [Moneuplotes crassus]